ncbi:MAG: thiol peroxidase [Planctomycetota bacterium]
MATVTFKGDPLTTVGEPPAVGTSAPAFSLTGGDLAPRSLADYSDDHLILNVFPSLDTGVCAASVRSFNEKAAALDTARVLGISMDLPFAQGRFCESNGIDKVEILSAFRSHDFGRDYGLLIDSGPLKGLLARCVLVLGPDRTVVHAQLVPEIAEEPDYAAALAAVGK